MEGTLNGRKNEIEQYREKELHPFKRYLDFILDTEILFFSLLPKTKYPKRNNEQTVPKWLAALPDDI